MMTGAAGRVLTCTVGGPAASGRGEFHLTPTGSSTRAVTDVAAT